MKTWAEYAATRRHICPRCNKTFYDLPSEQRSKNSLCPECISMTQLYQMLDRETHRAPRLHVEGTPEDPNLEIEMICAQADLMHTDYAHLAPRIDNGEVKLISMSLYNEYKKRRAAERSRARKPSPVIVVQEAQKKPVERPKPKRHGYTFADIAAEAGKILG